MKNADHDIQQQEFIRRCLQSRDEAHQSQEYFSAEEVLEELDEMLRQAAMKRSVQQSLRVSLDSSAL